MRKLILLLFSSCFLFTGISYAYSFSSKYAYAWVKMDVDLVSSAYSIQNIKITPICGPASYKEIIGGAEFIAKEYKAGPEITFDIYNRNYHMCRFHRLACTNPAHPTHVTYELIPFADDTCASQSYLFKIVPHVNHHDKFYQKHPNILAIDIIKAHF